MNKRGFLLLIFIIAVIFTSSINAYNFRNQTEIITDTWWPFYTPYGGGAAPVKGWPSNNSTDSDIIKNLSVYSHIAFTVNSHVGNQAGLLDWAQKTDQGIALTDYSFRDYIKGEGGNEYSIDLLIQEIVDRYSNNPSYRGVSLADEPYNYVQGSLDTAMLRARYIIDKFKQYDHNGSHKYYFPIAGPIPIFTHCKIVDPDIMLKSGEGYLHDPFAMPLNGSRIQTLFNTRISMFKEEYLCTENWGIPFGYSIPTSNWGGIANPIEARVTTYLMLAHGGKYVLWFVYSTDYGLVWKNDVKSLKDQYFTF